MEIIAIKKRNRKKNLAKFEKCYSRIGILLLPPIAHKISRQTWYYLKENKNISTVTGEHEDTTIYLKAKK